jgi:hypothetical protein
VHINRITHQRVGAITNRPTQGYPAGFPEASRNVTTALEAGSVSRRMLFPENGPPLTEETWTPIPIRDPNLLEEVIERLAQVESATQPAPRGELASRVIILLSHYRSDPQPPEIQSAIADDWAEDLGPYPLWVINEAARQWRQTKVFKPQPSEMIRLCQRVSAAILKERYRLRATIEASEAVANPITSEVAELTHQLARKLTMQGSQATER